MSYHKSSTSILSSLDKDYIEEGRRDIYKWGESRTTRRRGIRGWAYAFKKRFIDKSILRSFLHNLTVSLLLQLILSGLFTYTCQKLDLYLDVHIALFVSPIIFPLAFSINADFQRREHVLEDLALFKGGLIVLFFCHRDWLVPSGLSQEFLKAVTNKLKGLILNVKEYLLTEKVKRRSFILSVIYEDFSDISQMNEKMRCALPDSASLVQRLIHCHNLMFWAFERLRVIREYRSPRGIRSFTKVFIFVMPLLLSPYYVYVGKSSNNTWGPYYISLISTFVFGTLQGVQDVLDDPFDGISEDDVNLGSLEDWTSHSLLTNRTYTVGRFTVTASVPKSDEEAKKDTVAIETRSLPPSRNVSFKKKAPIKSILRRGSHRPEMPDTLSNVSEEDVGALFPEMAQRLHSMKHKGLTGSTTILPGFNIKEQISEDDSTDNSLLNTPVSLQRSVSDKTDEASTRRRIYNRTKNVSFSRDLDDDNNDNSPEGFSECSLNATDLHPLLRDSTRESRDPYPSPEKFSKDLIDSMNKLQKVSGTDRITPQSQKEDMPSSLASLFQPSISVSSTNCPAQKNGPKTVEIVKNEGNSSRFSVHESENDINKTPPHKDGSPRPSRFAVSPLQSTTSPSQPSDSITQSPNKVKVQLPPKKSEDTSVGKSLPSDDKKLGQTNRGLSSSVTSFNEDTMSNRNDNEKKRPSRFSVTKPPSDSKQQEDQGLASRFSVTKPPIDSKPQEDQQQPSRFSVSKPPDHSSNVSHTPQEDQQGSSRFSDTKPPSASKPQEDRKERQDSFWDFSGRDSVDSKDTSRHRSASIEDVLRKSDGSSGEVFI